MTAIAADRPPAHEGLQEPLPPPLERLLRRAAYDHAINDTRRIFVPQLHVGVPGAPHPVIPADTPADLALRTDAIAAMARRAARDGRHRTLVWLVRPGDLRDEAAHELDAAWLAAARAAYGEAEQPLIFVVVDRHGWRDPRSGLGRVWQRLRVK
jgi:hypothetical protein